jgi:hypothetical protein
MGTLYDLQADLLDCHEETWQEQLGRNPDRFWALGGIIGDVLEEFGGRLGEYEGIGHQTITFSIQLSNGIPAVLKFREYDYVGWEIPESRHVLQPILGPFYRNDFIFDVFPYAEKINEISLSELDTLIDQITAEGLSTWDMKPENIGWHVPDGRSRTRNVLLQGKIGSPSGLRQGTANPLSRVQSPP